MNNDLYLDYFIRSYNNLDLAPGNPFFDSTKPVQLKFSRREKGKLYRINGLHIPVCPSVCIKPYLVSNHGQEAPETCPGTALTHPSLVHPSTLTVSYGPIVYVI